MGGVCRAWGHLPSIPGHWRESQRVGSWRGIGGPGIKWWGQGSGVEGKGRWEGQPLKASHAFLKSLSLKTKQKKNWVVFLRNFSCFFSLSCPEKSVTFMMLHLKMPPGHWASTLISLFCLSIVYTEQFPSDQKPTVLCPTVTSSLLSNPTQHNLHSLLDF